VSVVLFVASIRLALKSQTTKATRSTKKDGNSWRVVRDNLAKHINAFGRCPGGGLENEAGKNAGRRQGRRQGGGSSLPHFHCGHAFSILQIKSY
jgi:hypothetical protein